MNMSVEKMIDEQLEQQYWQHLKCKMPSVDTAFFYGVKSTKIYCRSGCPSPLPLRKNVVFFSVLEEAKKSGYRACKRCQPETDPLALKLSTVTAICHHLHQLTDIPSLHELSEMFYMSPSHLSRLFKSVTGLTPREYALALRQNRLSEALSQGHTLVNSIYSSGFNSSSRVYEKASDLLGMTPATYSKKGANQTIQLYLGQCYLGYILIGATAKGLCSITLGDSPHELLKDLDQKFANATLIEATKEFHHWVTLVIEYINQPQKPLKELPLDIQGTLFQYRVWKTLLSIPVGETRSYGELAKILNKKGSAQAIGQACGANPLALLIPCHRVVKQDGSLSGYRWGVTRKSMVLEREKNLGYHRLS